MRESMIDRPKHRLRRAALALSVSAVLTGTTSLTAAAQQAYFRGEAEPGESVIVNLSVIEKLTSGAQTSAPPASGTPMPVSPRAQSPAASPTPVTPQASVPRSVAPAPSTAPRSTLMVDPGTGSATASAPQPAATPVPSAPPPKPALADQSAPLPKPTPAPPPPETTANTASIPKPAPAPEPTAPAEPSEPKQEPASQAVPKPAPAAPPQSEIAAAPAAPAEPESAPPAAEPAQSNEITPPPPPPAMTPEPDPAPAAEETPDSEETPQVASVDLTAVDRAGVATTDDGISVLFTKDSQDLPKAAEAALTELAEKVKSNDAMTVKLLGYSEPIGEAQSKPRRLALFRALAVRTFLLKQGIDSRRMTVQALGTKDPHEGRAANRVDLIVAEN